MPVEAATYVADLQPVNPPSTDPRSQGDDHLRLIKQVLQNTFGGASRAWQVPGTLAITGSTTLAKANGESMIYCSTASGAVTVTLPTLVAGDAGWKVRICKTSSDANPMFIAPATGTLSSGGLTGLAKARRCIPGVQITAIWDGSNWFVTRAGALPIGSMIDYSGATLPPGFEWPRGTALSSAANYPEYNAVTGGLATPDMRGRLGIPLDNLGGTAAGRLSGGFISGSVIGSSGGSDGVTLSVGNLPSHQHAVFLKDAGHLHSPGTPGTNFITDGGSVENYAAGGGVLRGNPATTSTNTTGITIGSVSGTANDNQTATIGSGTAVGVLQPSMMITKLLVVE